MRVLAEGKYVAREEGGTWPTPMDEPDTSLEWRLRYGTPKQLIEDRYLAASVVSAYRELIRLPRNQREAIIRDLRAAIKTARETGAEHAD